MGYIRVRDFAQDNNCTAQNIYKHLRKYTQELEGHVITGPGKQGQLLDDEAQTFLRSVMYPKTVTVDNDAMAAEMADMRRALLRTGEENLKLASQLAKVEGERDRALMDAGQYQKLLAASNTEKEAREKEIQKLLDDQETQKQQLAKVNDENFELRRKVAEGEAREYAAEENRKFLADKINHLKEELGDAHERIAWASRPWYRKFLDWLKKIFRR